MTWPLPPLVLLAAGPVKGSDARRAAQQELSHAQYHRDDPSLPSRILSWVFGRLGRLDGATVGQSALGVVAVLLVAIAVMLLVRAGRPVRTSRKPGTRSSLLSPVGRVDHARAAVQLAETGRFAEALREWLRAAVRTLEDRAVLDARPGRTADDIARTAGAHLPAAAAELRAATDAFDAIWFGGRVATSADAEAGRLAAEGVRRAPIRTGSAEDSRYRVPG